MPSALLSLPLLLIHFHFTIFFKIIRQKIFLTVLDYENTRLTDPGTPGRRAETEQNFAQKFYES